MKQRNATLMMASNKKMTKNILKDTKTKDLPCTWFAKPISTSLAKLKPGNQPVSS